MYSEWKDDGELEKKAPSKQNINPVEAEIEAQLTLRQPDNITPLLVAVPVQGRESNVHYLTSFHLHFMLLETEEL